MQRRAFLELALGAAVGAPLSACGGGSPSEGGGRILLASPIWNVRAPMIMTTFAEAYDFSGRTVHPVTTHAMSGLGTTPDGYARSCRGARIGTGLAVRGEKVRSAGAVVDSWASKLRRSM